MTHLLTKLFFVRTAHAEITAPTLDNPLNTNSVTALISSIFDFLLSLAAIIAPIFIIIGAFQMLTSAGNAEKFSQGKKTILYTVIGFLIVLGAKGIVDIIKKSFNVG